MATEVGALAILRWGARIDTTNHIAAIYHNSVVFYIDKMLFLGHSCGVGQLVRLALLFPTNREVTHG